MKAARLFGRDLSAALHPPHGTDVDTGGRFPPVYALLLALTGTVDAGIDGVRWVGAALAATAAATFSLLLRRHLPPRWTLGLLLVVAANRGVVHVLFSYVMSDGLYVALALGALLAVEPLLADGGHRRWWLHVGAASALVALGFGTRLVGAGGVLAVALAIGFFAPAPRRRRVVGAGVILVAGAVPTLAWLANQSVAGSVGGRDPSWTPLAAQDWDMVDTLPAAYLPGPVYSHLPTVAVRVLLVLAIGALVGWTVGRVRAAARSDAPTDVRLCAAFATLGWSHLLVLLVSRVAFDPWISIAGRHTMLWWICLLAAGGLDLHRRSVTPSSARHRIPALSLAAVAALALVVAGAPALVQSLRDPIPSWYTVRQEEPSPLTEAVRALPRGTRIATDREDVVYLFAGRVTQPIPTDPEQIQAPPDRAALRTSCRRADVVVLYGARGLPRSADDGAGGAVESVTEIEPGRLYRCRPAP